MISSAAAAMASRTETDSKTLFIHRTMGIMFRPSNISRRMNKLRNSLRNPFRNRRRRRKNETENIFLHRMVVSILLEMEFVQQQLMQRLRMPARYLETDKGRISGPYFLRPCCSVRICSIAFEILMSCCSIAAILATVSC